MFSVALTRVLITLCYVIPGFILCKIKKASAEHLSTLSSVLIYFGSPCLIVSAFLSLEYSKQAFIDMCWFALVSFLVQVAFMVILFLLLRKKFDDCKYRLLTIGSVLGNVGFFGLPVVKSLFPNEPIVACYSSVFVVTMNVIVFTMGVYCLTNDKKYMSLKSAIISPSNLGLAIGLPLFLLSNRFALSADVVNAVGAVEKMTTPLCMVILGIRLATVAPKDIFLNGFTYVICLGKLVLFPLFCYLAVYFLPFSATFKSCAVILSGTPCASIVLNLSEIHNGEKNLPANSILLSTIMCFITIPLLALLPT